MKNDQVDPNVMEIVMTDFLSWRSGSDFSQLCGQTYLQSDAFVKLKYVYRPLSLLAL